ncbi:MAG: bifunctional phosphoribosylaminoimidazolecarboxamide formyltransferase/IMP cyclohydrolase [Spirochaeta sp. LUC14_002_19_P3]|nr:MAG: bifunctional phosphoribosylaminoimidazolecarboxamide formyltransferase/IMP cyclohydrolase [Spirochaeta sp. LUC14_002_19_P3]
MRALISVYDKIGIVEFAEFLIEAGYGILSTGGTSRFLKEAGAAVTEVSAYTGAKEILGGRVKTLHPKIHGGILARGEDESHAAGGMETIGVVVANLYPFVEKSAEGLSMDELVEFIDIGGPTMLRAAAKNHAHVIAVCDPADYAPLMEEWRRSGGISLQTRRRLAGKVFTLTSSYDAAIAHSFHEEANGGKEYELPKTHIRAFRKVADLRYGENPHQRAAWYLPASPSDYGALSNLKQHQGKTLSFNNLRDLDGAWKAVNEFDSLACVGVKHATPCAAALGTTALEAWTRTREADPVSIFGGIAAFNREVDEETACALCEIFLEVIAAPGYSQGALELFKKKPNLRVLTLPEPPKDLWEALPVDGGLCVQETDRKFVPESAWSFPTQAQPSARQRSDLTFAWRVVKHVKSNGIVLAKDGATVGIGSGQPSRIGAVNIAIAGNRTQDAVMASDAFFPFDDVVKASAKARIAAIIQPGGSIRDADSIQACNEAGIAMVFTGQRCFRH